ncbi:MAG: hypothetical protein GDA46_04450 [Bdellovibrionales bacterium]|nr:hypothetical protein [Bdellovibrionales bacterium]
MANRYKSYDKVLAQKFKNSKYACLYLMNIIKKEKLSLEDALRETIKAMGLKSFSNKSGLSIQAVSDFVAKRKKWSMNKISNHIENVFKLKVKLSLELQKTGGRVA